MSKRQVMMLLGVWVAGFLFLGFPESVDKWIGVVSGLLVVIISYSLQAVKEPKRESDSVPYVEHRREDDITSRNSGDR